MGLKGPNGMGYQYQVPQSQAGHTGGKRGGKEIDTNNISMLSIPKQTKFFTDRLKAESDQNQSRLFDYTDLVRIGKEMNIQVGDFKNFIEKLNTNNIIIHKGLKQYELLI